MDNYLAKRSLTVCVSADTENSLSLLEILWTTYEYNVCNLYLVQPKEDGPPLSLVNLEGYIISPLAAVVLLVLWVLGQVTAKHFATTWH